MKKKLKLLILFILMFVLQSNTCLLNSSEFLNITRLQSLESSRLNKKELKNIVVFIEFSDSDTNVEHHLDDEQSVMNAYEIYNSDGFEMETVKGKIIVPSFKSYYERESYGQLSVTTDFFPKQNDKVESFKDDKPIGYYLKYTEDNTIGYKSREEANEREAKLIQNAVSYISNQLSSYGFLESNIDTNNDGLIDAISFVVEGQPNLPVSITWQDLLWNHKSSNKGNISAKILNKGVGDYNFLYAGDYTQSINLFSKDRGQYGSIVHEFGHTLGFSDLYRYGNSTELPVGFFDVMGNVIGSFPQHFLTYFISEYNLETNWHEPLPVIDKTTHSVTLYKPDFINTDEMRAVKIQVDSNKDEYFIVEYHEKQNTYDTSSVDKSGIIVYRVNEKNKYLGNNGYGTDGKGDHIFVFRPGEETLGSAGGNLTKATLNMDRSTLGKTSSSNDAFDNKTIYYSDGSNSGIIIDVLSQTDNSITFDINFPEITGSGTSVDPYLISTTDEFLYLMKNDTSNKYYKLLQDLDFKNVDYPKIDFQGNFDGNYKTIHNISSIGTGVFSSLGTYKTHTEIKNLFVENINVSPDTGNHLGGFASLASNVTITNVHLISGSVNNIVSTVNSIASTGGFVGASYNDTIIENSSSMLDVTSPKNVGGFIGLNMNSKIKTSFTTGLVNGNENVGAFIGMQCITDNMYNVPEEVYYDYDKNRIAAVGGYDSWHNLDVLDASNLSKGIIGLSVQNNLTIQKSIPTIFQVISVPTSNIDYTLTSENSDILKVSDNTLLGLTKGITKVFADIKVGSNKMRLTSNVTVISSDELTEEEVFDYFNLTKKDDYVFINQGTAVEELKALLKTHEDVSLKNIKDSNGTEISDCLITTNMKFTLNFNNTDHTYTTIVLGDVTEDGVVDLVDVMYALRVSLNLVSSVKETTLLSGDINNSKNIDLADVMYILRYALKLSN